MLGGGRGSHSRCSMSRWLPSVVMGALLSDAVKPCLALSRKGDSPLRCSRAAAPFGRSESPSISRVSLPIQRRTGLPFRCSRPTAPFGRKCDASVCPFRVALRARWRTGLSLPVQQSRWLPSVVMGALLPTRQPRLALSRKGDSPSGAAEPQLPSDAVRVPPSVASPCIFSIGRGSPFGGSRAAGSLRLHGSPPSDESNRASNILTYSVSDGALPLVKQSLSSLLRRSA